MKQDSFSRQDTKILKGAAILFMLAHHLFALPNRVIRTEEPISMLHMGDIAMAEYIGRFGNICVGLFMFLGGYGIYKVYQAGKLDILDKIKKLYLSYWKVFFVFVPIGFLFFRNQPTYTKNEAISHVFAHMDVKEFISNLTGFTWTYNSEWWFFMYYVIAIVTAPLVLYLIEHVNSWICVALIVVCSIFFDSIAPVICEQMPGLDGNDLFTWFFCQKSQVCSFWIGCVMAKTNALSRLIEKMQQLFPLNVVTDLIWFVICIVLRNSVLGNESDLVMIPFLCVLLLDLVKKLKLNKVFSILGENSTNMWLLHSFFCYYFYQIAKVVFYPRYAVLVFLLELLLAFAASMLLDLFWNTFEKMKAYLFERHTRKANG